MKVQDPIKGTDTGDLPLSSDAPSQADIDNLARTQTDPRPIAKNDYQPGHLPADADPYKSDVEKFYQDRAQDRIADMTGAPHTDDNDQDNKPGG